MQDPPSQTNGSATEIRLSDAEPPATRTAPTALEQWEQEGGGLAQAASEPPRATAARRKRKSRDDTIADCRANSASDMVQAGTMDSRKSRMRMEDSAAAWGDRANLLQRLNDSGEKRDALDSAERSHVADRERLRAKGSAPDPSGGGAIAEMVTIVTPDDVIDRLAREVEVFDALRGGAHKFNNVRRYNSPSGANWTANFGARGGEVRLRDAVSLHYMREALLQVQTEMPHITFPVQNRWARTLF
jgi:hypothetical protein